MAFESLTERLSKAFRNITGKGKLTEKNMEDMLKEVRLALLEADVNYKIVKDFLEHVRIKALGQDVYSALNPSQMVVKIVRDELVALLGEKEAKIQYKESGITVVMMAGLQGTGKTTSCGKIARLAKNRENRKPLMIAADVVRPAAVEQLKVLGNTIGVEVFDLGVEHPALTVVREGMKYARANGYDTVFIDTAGRLHIDEQLMNELREIKAEVKPDEILLTVDAMTGQDIVQVAKAFHDTLQVSGLVVTKMDGDARGGGVLSVRAMTQVPVKFVGQGEKVDEMDYFYPDRMAERILGMGDLLTFIEQAQEKMDMESTQKTAERMMQGQFTLEDMLVQYEQMAKMGPLGNMMKMIPGLNQFAGQIDEDKAGNEMKRQKAIIQSMTKEERQDPSILRSSRKNRIAKGSGTTVQEVNKLINSYEKMKQMLKQMAQMQKSGRMPNVNAMKKAQKQAMQMNMRYPMGTKRRW
ncbi:MAG: signal recognition particle protein [Erysipelotrichaceae bacterium]|nr:signal recognition particle protein [Erysipelotrichaceae bacterium]